jgi:hypothetical protein
MPRNCDTAGTDLHERKQRHFQNRPDGINHQNAKPQDESGSQRRASPLLAVTHKFTLAIFRAGVQFLVVRRHDTYHHENTNTNQLSYSQFAVGSQSVFRPRSGFDTAITGRIVASPVAVASTHILAAGRHCTAHASY